MGRLRVLVATALTVASAVGVGIASSPAQAAANHWPHTVVNGFSTPTGSGFWILYSDGTVLPYGGAGYYGDSSNVALNGAVVGGAVTPAGTGYWLVARDGGIFSYGGARFYGSMGGAHLNKPVFSMAPTKNGKGYWLVARDGGIFSFGNATFHGSTGGLRLSQPINGITTSATGQGYRMVARDGGIFSFGDAAFYGSLPGLDINVSDVVGMAPTPSGKGYWIARRGGEIYDFGDARAFDDYIASACDPVTAIFSNPKAQGLRLITRSGATVALGKAPGGSSPTGAAVQCPPGWRTSSTITLDEYDRIVVRMTYDEVVTIIGGPGLLVEDYKYAGYDDAFYKWNGPGGSSVLIEFRDHHVVSKAQVGLNPPTISFSEFMKIGAAMSYQHVVHIVGGPGTLISETNIGGHDDALYRWTGPNGAVVLVRFEDNKEISKAQSGLA